MEKLQLEKAVAEAERLEEQAVAAIGPLSGQIRARTFLQLGQRRLARARWQSVGNGRRAVPEEDAAVNAETARLAARDLRLALRLSEIEPNPRLDVWLSSPRYELQAASDTIEFPVAIHNASDAAVEGELVIQAPPGWQVYPVGKELHSQPATFRVEPQQRLVVPFHAQPVGNGRRAVPPEGPAVLRVTARVGGRDTTPIAFSLE
jgi:hypothetical protein